MAVPFRYNDDSAMGPEKRTSTVPVNRSFLFILLAAVFGAGVFFGRAAWLFSPVPTAGDRAAATGASEEFRYLRRSIAEDPALVIRKATELQPFRYKVNALIEERISKGVATSVAVYFRDLDNGNWFGIRENESFSPESQLKAPLMIAYFKWAETNPLVLRRTLVYHESAGRSKPLFLVPPTRLEDGKAYTVNDLLFRMMAYSDGDAYELLAANIPPRHLKRISKELNMNYDPAKKDGNLTLSAYGAFLRVLFNASYLSEEMSEKALRYLSRSSFRTGMAEDLPAGVRLASKAGERVFAGAHGEQVYQLHEFGIIYHPQRPFLLGVTVRGADFDEMDDVIRDIASLVYLEVDRQLAD